LCLLSLLLLLLPLRLAFLAAFLALRSARRPIVVRSLRRTRQGKSGAKSQREQPCSKLVTRFHNPYIC
jgi:hypothetical protein